MISIRLKTDRFEALAQRAQAIGEDKNMLLVGAHAVKRLTVDWLKELDDTRANSLGGKRTHFYGETAKSISIPAQEGGGATFRINQRGFAQRRFGGKIEAGKGISSKTGQPTKYLAIPANFESYGKTPAEFSGLKFFPTKRGGGLKMVRAVATELRPDSKAKGARKASHDLLGDVVMFWLVPSLTQAADPSVLPSDEEMATAAADSMEEYLTRKLRPIT